MAFVVNIMWLNVHSSLLGCILAARLKVAMLTQVCETAKKCLVILRSTKNGNAPRLGR